MLNLHSNAVTTNFVYFPRSRPSVALPPAMVTTPKPPGVVESAEWRCFKSTIPTRSSGVNSIVSSVRLLHPAFQSEREKKTERLIPDAYGVMRAFDSFTSLHRGCSA